MAIVIADPFLPAADHECPIAHAIRAIEGLGESWFINWVVRGSIYDPSMGGDTYHQNWRLFGAMERYLSVQQICHAADTLNSYCDSILADILDANPADWENLKTFFGKQSTLERTSERLRSHRQNGARTALRDGIGPYWHPESDVICELRNKLVHQGGSDPDRKVQQEIDSKNGNWCIIQPDDLVPGVIPVSYSEDDLAVNAQTGYWACRHVQSHIHSMDQNLCARFSLKRVRYRARNLKYGGSSSLGGISLPPGAPLPSSPPPRDVNTAPKTPAINPDYSMITSEKEIACARARMRLRDQLDEFIRRYCEDAGVEIYGVSGGMPGSVLSHTIRGHDLSVIYSLRPADRSHDREELIEVRIREFDFEPLMTIFGTNSQMRDYKSSSFTTDAAEYLKACIDRTLR